MNAPNFKRVPGETGRAREIQIRTRDLTVGMYVTRLDSSAAFEGAAVETADDIERLRSQCDHVYIDPERSDRYAFLLIPQSVDP